MKKKMYDTSKSNKDKCIVIVVCESSKDNKDRKLDEITRLAESTDLEVVASFSQNIREFNRSTIIGTGKVEEIKKYIDENEVDLAIIDYALTGSQARNLSNAFGVRVLDRIGLILDIFAKRANSAEAKIQVKLAQSRYLLPRLADVKETSNRYGGGAVGMRGPGETKLELDRRVLEKEIDRLKKEIISVKEKRKVNRREREKNGIYRVALVGYTNAGKSSLLNVLAKENIYAEDKYFATLDTTSRKMYLKEGKSVLLTDTVGFISNLPHELVDAFSATLEESADADLILHVFSLQCCLFCHNIVSCITFKTNFLIIYKFCFLVHLQNQHLYHCKNHLLLINSSLPLRQFPMYHSHLSLPARIVLPLYPLSSHPKLPLCSGLIPKTPLHPLFALLHFHQYVSFSWFPSWVPVREYLFRHNIFP